MITPDDQLVLLDFNAARNYLAEKREDTELLGTRGYAAPEQYGFGESSERTDIYAAGVLFRAMLTGSEDPRSFIGGRAGKIIDTCTKMDPSERYPSAEKLKEALRKTSGGAVPGAVSWRRFLPPGFRAGKPGYMIGMSVLYVFLISLVLTIVPTNCPPGFLRFERICLGIALLLIILFSGNYLNMQGSLARMNGRKTILRILLVILIDMGIFCAAPVFCSIVENLMVS